MSLIDLGDLGCRFVAVLADREMREIGDGPSTSRRRRRLNARPPVARIPGRGFAATDALHSRHADQ
jgi:hypothetical protein